MIHTATLLAADWTSSEFFSQGIGKMIQSFSTMGGILVVVAGLAFAVRNFARGQGIGALKSVIGGIAVGAFLMNLSIIGTGLDAGKSVVNAVFNTGSTTVQKGQ
ncbi:MAG TPA: hypothetical protein VHD87_12750 [Acidimicrobiales bacterium]|nr:hypothetical protein [Acidimicrobiales bacterium]